MASSIKISTLSIISALAQFYCKTYEPKLEVCCSEHRDITAPITIRTSDK